MLDSILAQTHLVAFSTLGMLKKVDLAEASELNGLPALNSSEAADADSGKELTKSEEEGELQFQIEGQATGMRMHKKYKIEVPIGKCHSAAPEVLTAYTLENDWNRIPERDYQGTNASHEELYIKCGNQEVSSCRGGLAFREQFQARGSYCEQGRG